jgi:hypothetical protein
MEGVTGSIPVSSTTESRNLLYELATRDG